jgi:hypothetical protein
MPAHNNFIAAITATTVMAKLTQGPQSMTPAMTASAKSGQKDLPTSSPACATNECGGNACDKNVRDTRVMLRSVPLSLNFKERATYQQEGTMMPRLGDQPGRNCEGDGKFPVRRISRS